MDCWETAIAGTPSTMPSNAAATVPEYETSSPRFEPWLIPETMSSGEKPAISPSEAKRTQSTGVPSVAYPSVPSPKSTSSTTSGRRVVMPRPMAERFPSGAIVASSTSSTSSSARRSVCRPSAAMPSSLVSRTRTECRLDPSSASRARPSRAPRLPITSSGYTVETDARRPAARPSRRPRRVAARGALLLHRLLLLGEQGRLSLEAAAEGARPLDGGARGAHTRGQRRVGRDDDEVRGIGVLLDPRGDRVVSGVAAGALGPGDFDTAGVDLERAAVEDQGHVLPAPGRVGVDEADEPAGRAGAVAPPPVGPGAHDVVAVDEAAHGPACPCAAEAPRDPS